MAAPVSKLAALPLQLPLLLLGVSAIIGAGSLAEKTEAGEAAWLLPCAGCCCCCMGDCHAIAPGSVEGVSGTVAGWRGGGGLAKGCSCSAEVLGDCWSSILFLTRSELVLETRSGLGWKGLGPLSSPLAVLVSCFYHFIFSSTCDWQPLIRGKHRDVEGTVLGLNCSGLPACAGWLPAACGQHHSPTNLPNSSTRFMAWSLQDGQAA